MDINYIVNPEQRLVVCIIHGEVSSSGVARCNPEDQFKEELGKDIARRRAIIKYNKKLIRSWKEDLAYVLRRKKSIAEDERFINAKIRKLEATIGKINTEIDNILEFNS